jgi:hypothetical protein
VRCGRPARLLTWSPLGSVMRTAGSESPRSAVAATAARNWNIRGCCRGFFALAILPSALSTSA